MAGSRSRAQWFFEGLSLLLVMFMFAMLAVHWRNSRIAFPALRHLRQTERMARKGFPADSAVDAVIVWIVMTPRSDIRA